MLCLRTISREVTVEKELSRLLDNLHTKTAIAALFAHPHRLQYEGRIEATFKIFVCPLRSEPALGTV